MRAIAFFFFPSQVSIAAGDATGPDDYGKDAFCRQALMDRNGSEVLSR